MLVQRDIVEIDESRCNGCGLCVPDCAENAIAVIDGKARVIADHFCDGLGACLAACPQGALRIIRREAVPFDEHAVHAAAQRIASADEAKAGPQRSARSCPSALPDAAPDNASADVRWPLKLRLMPPDQRLAPGSDLLLCADCAPAASSEFHAFRNGRTLLLACPKFEDVQALAARLGSLLAANPTAEAAILRMEVPCCRGLRSILAQALREAGRSGRIDETIMRRDGAIREKTPGDEMEFPHAVMEKPRP